MDAPHTLAPTRPPGRWRTFADTIALVLGLNVWLALVVLPGLFVGAWSSPRALVLAVPLATLALGVSRRSDAILLFGFPTTLLLPVALAPEIIASHIYGPIHFAVVALGLVAYLFGASVLTSFKEPPSPRSTRPLSSALAGIPQRWRRRARVYTSLTILSAVVPAVLLYSINFDPSTTEFLHKMYPGRAGAYLAVVNLGLLLFWFLIYSRVLLAVLEANRTGDAELAARLAAARPTDGRPRPAFYVAALVALFAIAVLLLRP